MKVLYWNARGIANDNTKRALKHLVHVHKPLFVGLSEPFVLPCSIPVSFWRSMGLSFIASNDRGTQDPNLWLLCHSALSPTVVSTTSQQLSLSCSIDGVSFILTLVYAKTSAAGRRALWQDLVHVHALHVQGPWVVLGDFNCVLGAHEKRGGGPPVASSCRDFQQMCDSCGLIDIPMKGLSFTWSNRRTEVRLDRALSNFDWLESWASMECCTLTKVASDHCPILLSCARLTSIAMTPFRFQSFWLQVPNFITLISDF